MLENILDLEKKLIRLESVLLVFCVIGMLLLAAYNVAYRNILVPWQSTLLSSGPPLSQQKADGVASPEAEGEGDGDFAGGFGEADPSEEEDFEGGFGAAPDEEPSSGESDDFEGGFGDSASDEDGDFEGGFGASGGDEGDGEIGGGFGSPAEEDSTKEADERDVEQGSAETTPPDEPRGGPPPDGSFADTMVGVINTMKLGWADILLRQMVIISGFLGAMLATRRRSHITIDAVGKLLDGRPRHIVDAITSFFSVAICILLAVAGWDLVKIGLEYPSELLPWAEEWTFQMVFPIGFGLLALHFVIRGVESIDRARRGAEVGDSPGDDEGAAGSEKPDDDAQSDDSTNQADTAGGAV